jgi:succinate-acetate transporter protein
MSQATDRPGASTTAPEIPTQRPAVETPEVAAPEAPTVALGDPGMLALPGFIVAATALGLVLVGFVPAVAVAAAIPLIMIGGGLGVLLGALWAARLGQNANAAVFGIFAFFWLTYASLVLGLAHNWYAFPVATAVRSQELFLTVWLVVIGMLTLSGLRLPAAFLAVFALVEVALLFVLLGTINANANLVKVGGYVVLAFTAIGVYLFASGFSVATGGRAYPLGPPVIR